ncbi:hypothetical protein INR49_022068, partial [Caranx melampygus]
MLDFAQETEPGTLHLLLQQQLSSSSNYHVLQHSESCCRPSSHKNFSACFKQDSTMLTGNNGVCRVLVLMAKKMVVK